MNTNKDVNPKTPGLSFEKVSHKNCIAVSYYNEEGIHYCKYLKLENLWYIQIYSLIQSMIRTMRTKSNIPIYFDVQHELDGSIVDCKFNYDYDRLHNEQTYYAKYNQ